MGRGVRGATTGCKMGDPGSRRRRGDPDPWREQRGSLRAGGTYALWPFPGLVPSPPLTRSSPRVWGVRNGRGPPDAPWDLSLNAAVEAWSDVVAKKGSRRQRDWQGLRQLRVSVLPRVAAGGVFGLLRSAASGAPVQPRGGCAPVTGESPSGRGFPGVQTNTVVRTPYLSQCHRLGMAVPALE